MTAAKVTGRLVRFLTYAECIERGCTEAEAFEYFKGCPPARVEFDVPPECVEFAIDERCEVP